VVAGDHGESLGQHGEDAHGVFVYQATQRVPLILAGPGVPAGTVVGERVGLVDVAPTVLDLLGLPPLPGTDGRSVVPVLHGKSVDPRDYELESFFPLHAYGWSPLRALVRDEYKFVDAPTRELYRLSADPDEEKNLATSKRGLASRLDDALRNRTAGDAALPDEDEPELAEHRRRLESLGYLSGSGARPDRDPIDPKDGIGWIADLEAGRKAYQTGSPSDGIEPLRRLLARNPDNVPALLALAACHLGAGDPASAVAADRRALELRPDDDLVHFNLANALAAHGRTVPAALSESRRHYERALELNPRFADAYRNYASLEERAGRNAEALALLERARAAGVRDPDVEVRIAVFELKRGKVAAAEEAFLRALELHPRAEGPLEAMARITRRQGRTEESLEYYWRLLEVAPPGRQDELRQTIDRLNAGE
jgi:tetratricopeptide (TPR) repeat protein